MTVYECIAAVSSEIAQTGIAKNHNNAAQGYKFRGIDDVYNALAPIIAKHKLVILPRMMHRTQTEKQTRNGGMLFCVVVEAEFDFVSATDGTTHTVRMFGEAMDSADKATNKAMSAAFKYCCFQAFCIPIAGDDSDADASSPEPVNEVPPTVTNGVTVTDKTYPSSDGDTRPITTPQQKRLFAIAKKTGVTETAIKGHLTLMGIENTADIQRQNYDAIVAWVQAGGPVADGSDAAPPVTTPDEIPF